MNLFYHQLVAQVRSIAFLLAELLILQRYLQRLFR